MSSPSPRLLENTSQVDWAPLNQEFWKETCQLPIARQYTTLWVANGEITTSAPGSKKIIKRKCSVVMLSRSQIFNKSGNETTRLPFRVKFSKDDPASIAQRLGAVEGAAALMDESFATSASSEQPFPSTASIFQLAPDDGAVNDSGVDFPLPDSPELWGATKGHHLRGRPSVMRLRSATPIAESNGIYRKHSLFHENIHLDEPPLEMKNVDPWTFDEHLVISLLIASDDTPPKEAAGAKRLSILSRNKLLARTSEKIAKMGRRLRSMLISA
ncbi:hypothetical protein D9619_009735 [Psilocybe cf. subviscida]|uniref:Uncharacterized protein n=1 Tax=Psilocybe cf. subviscida TaxID=2480587 RepID=A0A8H5F6E3_9AGAR|nr:hypothetical protein D9619_009735 [Psilocybe cf. subviscida]